MRFFRILEWFWTVFVVYNGGRHRFLEVCFPCFFRARFGIEIRWIFGRWGPQKQQFYIVKTRFFTKSRFSENIRKNIDFLPLSGGQSDAKSSNKGVEKHVFFYSRFVGVFFVFFVSFGPQGGPRGPQKSRKMRHVSQQIDFGMRFSRVYFSKPLRDRIFIDFWWFLIDFLLILGRFFSCFFSSGYIFF